MLRRQLEQANERIRGLEQVRTEQSNHIASLEQVRVQMSTHITELEEVRFSQHSSEHIFVSHCPLVFYLCRRMRS